MEVMLNECNKIQSYLEINISDNIQEIVERGSDLQAYIARTGKMIADAKRFLSEKKKTETMKVIEDILQNSKYSAGVQNALVSGLCADEQYLLTWCERLNATCTHQLDYMRTLISLHKEEMKLSNVGKEIGR